ncbi:hypothetical protein ALNOE001_12370 [Candidatus Methanobinarius endosymbioticus]|uniref:Uncharacterized protein n=1 Tax=Candidatus Methanobinarius endosymbioticus TaxID=2006182 RepID=A0A366MAC0_9EURY|nr:hypothetical protein ALNOE001_12370 [Candidatus Methanobinarius endosymbioticus]
MHFILWNSSLLMNNSNFDNIKVFGIYVDASMCPPYYPQNYPEYCDPYQVTSSIVIQSSKFTNNGHSNDPCIICPVFGGGVYSTVKTTIENSNFTKNKNIIVLETICDACYPYPQVCR